MPIGQTGVTLTRGENGKKRLLNAAGTELSFKDVMPGNWTQVYGKVGTPHLNTPLGGLICGRLAAKAETEREVIALDCDNAAAWDLMTAIDPAYQFRFKSIGKEGGTIVYLLPEELVELSQYSIKTSTIHFEFMAKREGGANAMVYLPTSANQTKECVPSEAVLGLPPEQIVHLIKLLKPQVLSAIPQATESTTTNLPFNAPLIKQFTLESKASADAAGSQAAFGVLDMIPLVERVYQIFTPRKFRSAPTYVKSRWVHPNSDEILELGSWSEYIVGVSAIAGSDPSIDAELYTDFMQAFNAQVDDPMPPKRFLEEVISPMVLQKARIGGQPIWKYNEKWDQTSHTIVNQYGETLEYFTLENAANRFVEYNHITKELVEIQGARSLRDQVYSKDTDPQQEAPNAQLVKKLKLIRVDDSVKLPLGIFTDSQGHTILNTSEPTYPLRVLREPDLYADDVNEDNLHAQAFNAFIAHLVNDDDAAILFMKQVIAFHGRHLENIPVILYMVGVGGAGKSHFAQFMEQLFGANTTSRPSAEQMTTRFNDFLLNTALLILTETGDSATRAQDGIKAVLKTVTGEKTVDIESKGKTIEKNVPIFALPVLLSNEPWYQEDSADRRLFSIMPRATMIESALIINFEQLHGVRIIDYISEGIKLGIISKYLSGFCPRVLPEVPMTSDKQQLSAEQKDPIMVVKNTVTTGNWFKLFDLMEEHSVDLFFTVMESPKIRDKNCLFKNQLVELVKNIRGIDTFSLTDATISRAFSARWMPNQATQYRPRKDNPLAMKLGHVKWAIGIHDAYEDWKLTKLSGDEL